MAEARPRGCLGRHRPSQQQQRQQPKCCCRRLRHHCCQSVCGAACAPADAAVHAGWRQRRQQQQVHARCQPQGCWCRRRLTHCCHCCHCCRFCCYHCCPAHACACWGLHRCRHQQQQQRGGRHAQPELWRTQVRAVQPPPLQCQNLLQQEPLQALLLWTSASSAAFCPWQLRDGSRHCCWCCCCLCCC